MNKSEILLGYDDPHMLEAIGWALEEEGYHVTTASSAEALLGALPKKDFDLVLIDLDLHRANGMDVVQKAKELTPETMVIILCCEEDIPNSHDALRFDADDYIIKPCSKAKLWKRVVNCLARLEPKRNTALSETDVRGLSERDIKILRSMLDEMEDPLVSMKETLELIESGAYGKMDPMVETKLRGLNDIDVELSSMLNELLRKISKITGDLDNEQDMLDWRENIMNPVLGNIPG